MKKLNVISLFDGMSCGRLALERAGVKVNSYHACEIDKYAQIVSMSNWNDVTHHGSVIDFDVDSNIFVIPDLVIGGSPCQSFSRSGDNSGFDGKSKLFWEYVRILKEAIRVNPNVKFLLENVVMKKEWEEIITDELGVEPILIDSKLVSAQKRQRLYWTNIEGVEQPKDRNIQLSDIVLGDRKNIDDHPVILEWLEDGAYVRNATKQGFLLAENGDSVNLEVPNSKTRRGRVGKGKTNTLNTACNYGMMRDYELIELNLSDYEQLQNLPIGYTEGVSDNQRKKMIGNGWTVDVIAHIFENLKR